LGSLKWLFEAAGANNHTSEKLWWHESLVNTRYGVIDGCLIKPNDQKTIWIHMRDFPTGIIRNFHDGK
jgi:hypothetical protein